MSNPPNTAPRIWAWRRYQLGIPVVEAGMSPTEPGSLSFWPSSDFGQQPHLNRWENMEPSFAGFVGDVSNLACAYWLSGILKQLKDGELVFRTWNPAVDAAEAVEFVEQQLLGVWFGEKTPFILTETPTFLEEGKQNGGVLFRF